MTKALKLQELFDLAAKNAARIWNESHEVLPMWHAIQGNGENTLIATPWSDDDEKEIALAMLRDFFREKHVKRFAFIVEAWVRQAKSLEDVHSCPVSEHEDRREVLMISAEDRDGTAMMGWYYILRPEIGPPRLSPLEVKPFDGQVGRMTGLLT